jgi:hypothetical protein
MRPRHHRVDLGSILEGLAPAPIPPDPVMTARRPASLFNRSLRTIISVGAEGLTETI